MPGPVRHHTVPTRHITCCISCFRYRVCAAPLSRRRSKWLILSTIGIHLWGIGAYAVLLLMTWIVVFPNVLMHSRDEWASMPTGLIRSVTVTHPACAPGL